LSKRQNKSPSNGEAAALPPAIAHIPLLNILSETDRRRMLGELSEARYSKDAYIFREGDPTEYFHILKEGFVKCVKSSPEGKECTLKMLMPGDLFCCDAATFDGGCHPGAAQSMGDVSILRMRKTAYFELLRRSPDAALEVIRYLGARLNEAQEKAKLLALDRTDQRLAVLLLDLAERSGVPDPQGVRLAVRLTRQDMADLIGTTTETAIRIMSRFKKDRLVTGTANRLIIRDLVRLKSFASA